MRPRIMGHRCRVARRAAAVLCVAFVAAGCDSSDGTGPQGTRATIVLTTHQVHALDSVAVAIAATNPSDVGLALLRDSTFALLAPGAVATRVDISMDGAPSTLYFIGMHRAAGLESGGVSSWTIAGIDDLDRPRHLLVANGYSRSSTGFIPASVRGTIGDRVGAVNAFFVRVGSTGAVDQWPATTGTVTIESAEPTEPGSTCAHFAATSVLSCAPEIMHVTFTANSFSIEGALERMAIVGPSVEVPGVRITVTP